MDGLDHYLRCIYEPTPMDTSYNLYQAMTAYDGDLVTLRATDIAWDEWTCMRAARGGHIDVLQWVYTNGCPWDHWTFMGAAQRDDMNMMEWLYHQQCPWSAWAFYEAIENDHLDAVAWLFKHKCPWDAHACAIAAKRGNLTILRYLRAHGCPFDDSVRVNASGMVARWVRKWCATI